MHAAARRVLRAALCAAAALAASPFAGAATADIEAGEDAVLLEEHLDITIASPTSATSHHSRRIHILTLAGAADFDSIAVWYNPSRSVRSIRAAVIAPDGRRTEAKKNQVQDAAAYDATTLYDDNRIKAIGLTGVVPGAVVETSYEVNVSNVFYVDHEFALQERIPARSKTLTLRAPSDMGLRIDVRGNPEYARREEGGSVIHEWRVRDVPSYKPEPGMPPEDDVVPRVRFSLKEFTYGSHHTDAASWAGIARLYFELSEERTKPAPEVAAKARELTAGLQDPLARTRALYEFVQKNINYVSVQLGVGGYQPHDNATVLTYRYGDCKDKATLLIAMLRAVGLRGFPVLIRTRNAGVVDRDSPGLAFNHAIVAVPAADGYLFMDPTYTITAFGDLPVVDQGVNVLVVREDGTGELTQTPLFGADRNRRHWIVTAAISALGDLEGSYTMEAWGAEQTDLAVFLRETKPREREDALAEWTSRLARGAVLLEHAVTPPAAGRDDPLRITARFKVPRYVTRAGTLEIVAPHLVRQPSVAVIAAYPGRRNPLFFEGLWSETSEIRLRLPPGRTVKKMPQERDFTAPGLSGRVRYALETSADAKTFVVSRSVSFTQREIPVADYPALRQALQGFLEEEARAVTLVPETASSRIPHASPTFNPSVAGR